MITQLKLGDQNLSVDDSLSTRLQLANDEMIKDTGKSFSATSTFRTPQQQADLYAKSQAGEIGRAAPPGSSFHEKGLALDVSNWQEAQPYLNKYGLRNDLPDDKGHFSLGETAKLKYTNLVDQIEKARQQGKSDTEILDKLKTLVPEFSNPIDKSRTIYNTDNHIKNDRDLLNFLSVRYSGKMPTTPSVPTQSNLTPEQIKQNIQQKQTEQQKTVGGFLGNVISSTVEAGKGIYQTIRHPIQTISNVGQMLEGFAQDIGKKAISTATGLPEAPDTQAQQKANAVLNFYKQRYGGWQNVKDTIYNDPVGFAIDATVLLDAGASALAKVGEVSKISSLSEASKILSKAADTTNIFKIPENIVGGIKGKIAEKVGSQANTEAIVAAEKAGIKLPTAALTKGEGVRKIVQTAERGIFGDKLKQITEAAKEKLASNIEDIQKSITPEEISKEGIGGKVQEAYAKAEKDFKDASEKMYDEVSKQSKYRVASTQNTVQILSDIIDQEKQALGAGNKSMITKMQKILSSIKGTEVEFDNLRAMRTKIGQDLAETRKFPGDRGNPYLNRIYGALSQDIEETAKTSSPDLYTKFQEATQFYRENIRQLRSSVGISIKRSLPENIAKNFAKPNNASNLRLLKTIVGDDAMGYIGSSYLSDLVKKSTDFNGEFNLKKFIKEANKMDNTTAKEMLSSEQLTNLEKAKSDAKTNQIVQQAIADSQKGGRVLANEFHLAELGLAVTHPVVLLKTLVGEAAFAKFLLSPKGRAFLSGFKMPKGTLSKLMTQANNIAPVIAATGRLNTIQQTQ